MKELLAVLQKSTDDLSRLEGTRILLSSVFPNIQEKSFCEDNFRIERKNNLKKLSTSFNYPSDCDGIVRKEREKSFSDDHLQGDHSFRSSAYYNAENRLNKYIKKYVMFETSSYEVTVFAKLRRLNKEFDHFNVNKYLNGIISMMYDEDLSEVFPNTPTKDGRREAQSYTNEELNSLLRTPFLFTDQYNTSKAMQMILLDSGSGDAVIDYMCKLLENEETDDFFDDHFMFFLQSLAKVSSQSVAAENSLKTCVIQNEALIQKYREFGVHNLPISFENLEFLFGQKDDQVIQREIVWQFGQYVKILSDHVDDETIVEDVMLFMHDELLTKDANTCKFWLKGLTGANQEESISIITQFMDENSEDIKLVRECIVALTEFTHYGIRDSALLPYLEHEDSGIRFVVFTALMNNEDNIDALITHMYQEEKIIKKRMRFLLEKSGHYFSKNPNIIDKNICFFETAARRSVNSITDIFKKIDFEDYDIHYELGFCETMDKIFGTEDFGAFFSFAMCDEGGFAINIHEISFPVFYIHVDNHFTVGIKVFGKTLNIIDIGFKIDFDTRELLIDDNKYRRSIYKTAMSEGRRNTEVERYPYLQKNDDQLNTTISQTLYENHGIVYSLANQMKKRGITEYQNPEDLHHFIKSNFGYTKNNEVDFSIFERFDFNIKKIMPSDFSSHTEDLILYTFNGKYVIGSMDEPYVDTFDFLNQKYQTPGHFKHAYYIEEYDEEDFRNECPTGYNKYSGSLLCSKQVDDNFYIENELVQYEGDNVEFDKSCVVGATYRQIEDATNLLYEGDNFDLFHLSVPDYLEEMVGRNRFGDCVDNLEECYGTCTSTKDSCDNSFKTCVLQKCAYVQPGCQSLSEIFEESMSNGVTNLIYQRSQNLHCSCQTSSQQATYSKYSWPSDTEFGAGECDSFNEIDWLPKHIKHNFKHFCESEQVQDSQRKYLYHSLISQIYFSNELKDTIKNLQIDYEDRIEDILRETYLEDKHLETASFEKKLEYLRSIRSDILQDHNERIQKLKFVKKFFKWEILKQGGRIFKSVLLDAYLSRTDVGACDKPPQKFFNFLVISIDFPPPSYIHYATSKFQRCTQTSNVMKIVNKYWCELWYFKCVRVAGKCIPELVHINQRDSLLRAIIGPDNIPDTQIPEELEIDIRQPIEGTLPLIGGDSGGEQNKYMPEGFTDGKMILFSLQMEWPIAGVITFELSVEVYIQMGLDLRVGFTIYDMMLEGHLVPYVGLNVEIEAAIVILIVKGGVRGKLTIVGAELDIGAKLYFNDLPLALDIDAVLSMEALRYDVDAFVAFRTKVIFCGGWFPCGLDWGYEVSYDLFDGVIWKGSVGISLLKGSKSTPDHLPPVAVSTTIEIFENEVARKGLSGTDDLNARLEFFTNAEDQVSDLYFCSDYFLDVSTGELIVVPPKYFSGTCKIHYRVFDGDYESTSYGTVEVIIHPVATDPDIFITNDVIVSREDEEFSFTFSTHLVDRDGSENIESVWITGIPTGTKVWVNGTTYGVFDNSVNINLPNVVSDIWFVIRMLPDRNEFFGDQHSYWGFMLTLHSRTVENSTTLPQHTYGDTTKNIKVDIIPVNDQIRVSVIVPDEIPDIYELGGYYFRAIASDVDIFDFLVTCTVGVDKGFLSIQENVEGIEILGSKKYTDRSVKFRGTIDPINEILGDFEFTAGFNENKFGYNGDVVLNVTCCDGGSFGEGVHGSISTDFPRFDMQGNINYCDTAEYEFYIIPVNESPQIVEIPLDLRVVETESVTYTVKVVDDSDTISLRLVSNTGTMEVKNIGGWVITTLEVEPSENDDSEFASSTYTVTMSGQNYDKEQLIPIEITYTPVVDVCAQRVEMFVSDTEGLENHYIMFIEKIDEYPLIEFQENFFPDGCLECSNRRADNIGSDLILHPSDPSNHYVLTLKNWVEDRYYPECDDVRVMCEDSFLDIEFDIGSPPHYISSDSRMLLTLMIFEASDNTTYSDAFKAKFVPETSKEWNKPYEEIDREIFQVFNEPAVTYTDGYWYGANIEFNTNAFVQHTMITGGEVVKLERFPHRHGKFRGYVKLYMYSYLEGTHHVYSDFLFYSNFTVTISPRPDLPLYKIKQVAGKTHEDEEISISVSLVEDYDIKYGDCKLYTENDPEFCTYNVDIIAVEGKIRLPVQTELTPIHVMIGTIDWVQEIHLEDLSFRDAQLVLKDFRYIYTGEFDCFNAIQVNVRDNGYYHYYSQAGTEGPSNIFDESRFEPYALWVLIDRVNDPPKFFYNGTEKNACVSIELEGKEEGTIDLSGISIGDVDQGKKPGVLWLRAANGKITGKNFDNVLTDRKFVESNQEWIVIGKIEDLNNFLAGLNFTGDKDFFGDTYVYLKFSDQGSVSEDQTILEVVQWIDIHLENVVDDPTVYTDRRIFINEGYRREILENEFGNYLETYGRTPRILSIHDPDLNPELTVEVSCGKCYWMVQLSNDFCYHRSSHKDMECVGSQSQINDFFKDMMLYEPIGKGEDEIFVYATSETSLTSPSTTEGWHLWQGYEYKLFKFYSRSGQFVGYSDYECKANNAHLLTIHSKQENDFILSIAGDLKGELDYQKIVLGYFDLHRENYPGEYFTQNTLEIYDATEYDYNNFPDGFNSFDQWEDTWSSHFVFDVDTGFWDIADLTSYDEYAIFICKKGHRGTRTKIPVWINPVADPVVITAKNVRVTRNKDTQVIDLMDSLDIRVDSGYGWFYANSTEDFSQEITMIRVELGENHWEEDINNHLKPIDFNGYLLLKHVWEWDLTTESFDDIKDVPILMTVPGLTYGYYTVGITVFTRENLNGVESRGSEEFEIYIDGALGPHLTITKPSLYTKEGETLHLDPPPFTFIDQVYRSELECCMEIVSTDPGKQVNPALVSIDRSEYAEQICKSAFHDYKKISVRPKEYFFGSAILNITCQNLLGSDNVEIDLEFEQVHTDVEIVCHSEETRFSERYLRRIPQGTEYLDLDFELIDRDDNEKLILTVSVTGGTLSFPAHVDLPTSGINLSLYPITVLEGTLNVTRESLSSIVMIESNVVVLNELLSVVRYSPHNHTRHNQTFSISVSDKLKEIRKVYLIDLERVNVKPELTVYFNETISTECVMERKIIVHVKDDVPSNFEKKWHIRPELTISWSSDILVRILSPLGPSVTIEDQSETSITLKGTQDEIISSVTSIRIEHAHCSNDNNLISNPAYGNYTLSFSYDDKEIIDTVDNSLQSETVEFPVTFEVSLLTKLFTFLHSNIFYYEVDSGTHDELFLGNVVDVGDASQWCDGSSHCLFTMDLSISTNDANCANSLFYHSTTGESISLSYTDLSTDDVIAEFGNIYWRLDSCAHLNTPGQCVSYVIDVVFEDSSSLGSSSTLKKKVEIRSCRSSVRRRRSVEATCTVEEDEKVVYANQDTEYNMITEYPQLNPSALDSLKIYLSSSDDYGGFLNNLFEHSIESSGSSQAEIDTLLSTLTFNAGSSYGTQSAVITKTDTIGDCEMVVINFLVTYELFESPEISGVSTHHLLEQEEEEIDFTIDWKNSLGNSEGIKSIFLLDVPHGLLVSSHREHFYCDVDFCEFEIHFSSDEQVASEMAVHVKPLDNKFTHGGVLTLKVVAKIKNPVSGEEYISTEENLQIHVYPDVGEVKIHVQHDVEVEEDNGNVYSFVLRDYFAAWQEDRSEKLEIFIGVNNDAVHFVFDDSRGSTIVDSGVTVDEEVVYVSEIWNVTDFYVNDDELVFAIIQPSQAVGDRIFTFLFYILARTTEIYDDTKRETMEILEAKIKPTFCNISIIFPAEHLDNMITYEDVSLSHGDVFIEIMEGENFDISFEIDVIGMDDELHVDLSGLESSILRINGFDVSSYSQSVFDFEENDQLCQIEHTQIADDSNGNTHIWSVSVDLEFEIEELFYGTYDLTFEIYSLERSIGFSPSKIFVAHVNVLPIYSQPRIVGGNYNSITLIGNQHTKLPFQVENDDDIDGIRCNDHYSLRIYTEDEFNLDVTTHEGHDNLVIEYDKRADTSLKIGFLSLNEINAILKEVVIYCEGTEYSDSTLTIVVDDGGCSGAEEDDTTFVVKNLETKCTPVNHEAWVVNAATSEAVKSAFVKTKEGVSTSIQLLLEDFDKDENEYLVVFECSLCKFHFNEELNQTTKVGRLSLTGSFTVINEKLKNVTVGGIQYFNGFTNFLMTVTDQGSISIGTESYTTSYLHSLEVSPSMSHPDILGEWNYPLTIERRYDGTSYAYINFFTLEDYSLSHEAYLMEVQVECTECVFEISEELYGANTVEGVDTNNILFNTTKDDINSLLMYTKYVPQWRTNGIVVDEIDVTVFRGKNFVGEIVKTVANVTLKCTGQCCLIEECLTCDENGFCESCKNDLVIDAYNECVALAILSPASVAGIIIGVVLAAFCYVLLSVLIILSVVAYICIAKQKKKRKIIPDNETNMEMKETEIEKNEENGSTESIEENENEPEMVSETQKIDEEVKATDTIEENKDDINTKDEVSKIGKEENCEEKKDDINTKGEVSKIDKEEKSEEKNV